MLAASSWVWGWNTLVALGTLGLALGTGVLAWFTLRAVRKSGEAIQLQGESIKLQEREVIAVEEQTAALVVQSQAVGDQVVATQAQAEVSAAAFEAASRPALVGVVASPGWHTAQDAVHGMIPIPFVDDHFAQAFPDQVYYEATDEKIYCSVPLRNVGAGVAFIQRVELVTSRKADFPLTGKVTDPIVPRDETTRALFMAVRKQNGKASDWEEIVGIPGRGFAKFTIRVVYTGASHDLVTVTELETSQLPSGGYIYTAQQVWNGEGEDRQLLVSTENITT